MESYQVKHSDALIAPPIQRVAIGTLTCRHHSRAVNKRSVSLKGRRGLHHSQSVWTASSKRHVRTHVKPTKDTYDVVIVGAGISGALMAYALADGKRSIAMIDRREPVNGSSLASTAMILHELDVPLHALTAEIGKQKARRVWRRSARAVATLLDIAKAIDTPMKPSKSLYLAGDAYGARALREEVKARNAAGLGAVFLEPDVIRERFNLDRTGAIESDLSASANPARLTADILRAAQERGLEIIADVEVTAVRSERSHVFLATSQNAILRAEHVVLCTGYELVGRTPPPGHSVVSTWAIASKPHLDVPAWMHDYVVWEASDPYLYFRCTPDGRLIAGGEDEKDGEAYKRKDKSKVIAKKVGALLDVRFGKPDYTWSAPFGQTTHGMPLIGELPDAKHVWAVMGYGGNGITFSQIAAEIVSSAIRGKRDPDAGLFHFNDEGSPRPR